jgi:thioesterase domain-containing protein
MNPYTGQNRHLIVHADGKRQPLLWLQPGLQQATVIDHLGPDQPVYCIARPTQDRSRLPLTFDEITAYHMETVRNLCPKGPYALTGTYLHATIAFEVASQLLREGELISALILINPHDPATSRTELIKEPAFFRLRLNLSRALFHLEKTRRLDAKEKVAYYKKGILGKRQRKGNATRGSSEALGDVVNTPQFPRFRNVAESDLYAFRSHVLSVCAGSAILLRPTIRPRGAYDYPNHRWAELLTKGLDIQEVPGDSSSMWVGENARVVSQKISFLCEQKLAAAQLKSR